MTQLLVLCDQPYDGIALLTLSRPDELNAWCPEMGRQFFGAIDEVMADPQFRVVVITGAGRGFCAGASATALTDLAVNAPAGLDEYTDGRDAPDLAGMPKPTIAAINGPAAGLGLAIALFCDLRFAATTAKLTTAYARRGLVAESGTAWQLPRLVGTSRALDLLLSGRVITGSEAAHMGLVNGSVPNEELLPHVLSYAQDLVRHGSPTSWAVMKSQVARAGSLSLDAAAREATALTNESLCRPDLLEGIRSYLDRRPPSFGAWPALAEGRAVTTPSCDIERDRGGS